MPIDPTTIDLTKKPVTEDEMLDRLDAYDAARDAGDHELATRIRLSIPLDPGLAKAYVSAFGKEWLLKKGYDLSEADEVLGEGWLDKIPYTLGFLDKKNEA